MESKIEVVKCSLLGSVLSNLLLVLGTSLFCGGIVNLNGTSHTTGSVVRTYFTQTEAFFILPVPITYVQTQADVSTGLLILGVLCQSLPLMLRYAVSAGEHSVAAATTGLDLSRACSIVMLLAYVAYLSSSSRRTPSSSSRRRSTTTPSMRMTSRRSLASPVASSGSRSRLLIAILSEYDVGTIEV
ncbi:hypothetical protein BAE44_0026093 [Dichanthelium oligosanthes]|uniref:Sodium/calcium exchanger membrane region domain-containing protein n=1 Tax=Dichanthelium oligosanthes TaxID=888268 RepID=A0A1E5UJ96_9POAL|nr:hypothetical protein BAE44_0026093 [Dichanthelium oligosanthes]